MRKGLAGASIISLIALLLVTDSSFALEIHYGDTFSGKDVIRVLTEKAFNYTDNRCIRNAIAESRDHQAQLAVGSYISKIAFVREFLDRDHPTLNGLMATVTYKNERLHTEEIFDFGKCFVQSERSKSTDSSD